LSAQLSFLRAASKSCNLAKLVSPVRAGVVSWRMGDLPDGMFFRQCLMPYTRWSPNSTPLKTHQFEIDTYGVVVGLIFYSFCTQLQCNAVFITPFPYHFWKPVTVEECLAQAKLYHLA